MKRKGENGVRQGYSGSEESGKLMWNLGALLRILFFFP